MLCRENEEKSQNVKLLSIFRTKNMHLHLKSKKEKSKLLYQQQNSKHEDRSLKNVMDKTLRQTRLKYK